MKKIMLLMAVSILVISLLLSGCNAKVPPEVTPTTTVSETPTTPSVVVPTVSPSKRPSGGGGGGGGGGGSSSSTTLAAPSLTVSEGKVIWGSVANALSYELYENGIKKTISKDVLSYVPQEDGVKKIEVLAKGNGGTVLDSTKSNEVFVASGLLSFTAGAAAKPNTVDGESLYILNAISADGSITISSTKNRLDILPGNSDAKIAVGGSIYIDAPSTHAVQKVPFVADEVKLNVSSNTFVSEARIEILGDGSIVVQKGAFEINNELSSPKIVVKQEKANDDVKIIIKTKGTATSTVPKIIIENTSGFDANTNIVVDTEKAVDIQSKVENESSKVSITVSKNKAIVTTSTGTNAKINDVSLSGSGVSLTNEGTITDKISILENASGSTIVNTNSNAVSLDVANIGGATVAGAVILSGSGKDNVNKKTFVAVSGISVEPKTYDGSKTAEISETYYTYGDAINTTVLPEGLSIDVQGEFASKNANSNALVNLTLKKSGENADNYIVTTATPVYGVIKQREVKFPEYTVEKVYDQTVDIVLPVLSFVEGSVVQGDEVSIGNIESVSGTTADKNVGEGKTVTLSAPLTLSGADASNYALSQPTIKTNIAPIQLTVKTPKVLSVIVEDLSLNFEIPNEALELSECVGVLSGDNVTLKTLAKFEDNSPANSKNVLVQFSLSGTDQGNYAAPQDINVSATLKKELEINTATNPATYEDEESGVIYTENFVGYYSVTDFSKATAETLSIPSQINGKRLIEIDAWNFSETLKTLNLPSSIKKITRNWDNYEDSFGCGEISTITIPEENEHYKVVDNVVYSKDGKTLVYYPIGLLETSFTVPNSVEIIGECAIAYSKLESITLNEGLLELAFASLHNSMFLTALNIPASLEIFGEGTLQNANSLTAITVAEENEFYSVKDGVLFNKDKTELLHYPSAKAEKSYIIPETVASIPRAAFRNYKNLVMVKIPSSVEHITGYAFANYLNGNELDIYCEVAERPIGSGWDKDFDLINNITNDRHHVHYGHTGALPDPDTTVRVCLQYDENIEIKKFELVEGFNASTNAGTRTDLLGKTCVRVPKGMNNNIFVVPVTKEGYRYKTAEKVFFRDDGRREIYDETYAFTDLFSFGNANGSVAGNSLGVDITFRGSSESLPDNMDNLPKIHSFKIVDAITDNEVQINNDSITATKIRIIPLDKSGNELKVLASYTYSIFENADSIGNSHGETLGRSDEVFDLARFEGKYLTLRLDGLYSHSQCDSPTTYTKIMIAANS